jgi:hypothetical protein
VRIPDDLTAPEMHIWHAIETGESVSLLEDGTESERNPSNGGEWGPERTVRGEALAAILTFTQQPDKPRRAVSLHFARISGALDLEALELPCPLIFADCFFDEAVRLNEARLPKLVFADCHLPELFADQIETRGNVILTRARTGSVGLIGAHIGGQLVLNGAQLSNPEGKALNADGAQIDGGMICHEEFRAEGEIRLLGAHIAGQLVLNGAQLSNPEGRALNADGAQIDGGMFCDEGFRAEGEIRLLGTHIAGQLSLNGAHLINPNGRALSADGAQIDRGMFCDEGFRAEGEIRLLGTHIDRVLSFNEAQLSNPEGKALSADLAHIDGMMFCRNGFRSEGEIRLLGVHIAGQLSLNHAQLSNPNGRTLNAGRMQIGEDMVCREGFRSEGELHLPGAHIAGQLSLNHAQLSNPGKCALNLCKGVIAHIVLPAETPPEGTVDLSDARVRHLEDDWPKVHYETKIGGLVYETLSPLSRGMSARLDWLDKAEGGYLRQPYEQLAAVLRSAGRDDDARRVAIAKEESRRPELKYASRGWSRIYGLTVRYGYEPWRGLVGLFLIFAAGWPIFALAKAHGHFVVIAEKGQSLPQFHAWLYSLDCVLPVIGLGQKSYWSVTGVALWWQTFSILMGWFLVAVILAAVTTRLIRD